MVQRAELSITHSRNTVEPASHLHGDNSGWHKVAMIAPIIILGIGLLIYAITCNPSPPPPEEPCVDPIQQDPELKPGSQFCNDFKTTIWDVVKLSAVECQKDVGTPKGYFCLDSETNRLVSQCNMTAEVEAQINYNKQFAQPLVPPKGLELEEYEYLISAHLNALLGNLRNPNCESDNCCDLDQSQLHPREEEAIIAINSNRFSTPAFDESQEYLRLRASDSRKKTLFFSTIHSATGRPLSPEKYIAKLQDLNEKTDLKYKVVKEYLEMCHEIRKASQIGEIYRVYIQADQDEFIKNTKMNGFSKIDTLNLFSECFSNENSQKARIDFIS